MQSHSRAFRAFAVFTLIGFMPSSVQWWYFIPAATAQEVAADETTAGTTESSVPNDTLEESQRVLLAQQGVQVENDEALRQLKSAEVKPTETKPKVELPKPFSLAKNITPVVATTATAILGQTAGQAAAEQLQDAQDLRAAGDRVNAALGFFQILDTYPNTLEGKTAHASLLSMGEELMSNTIPATEVQAFTQQLPTWQQCQSAESKYILLALQYGQAVAARKRGDETAKLQYFEGVRQAGLQLASEHPDSALQIYGVRHLMEAAYALGGETPAATVDVLKEHVRTLSPSPLTWIARAMVSEHQQQVDQNPGDAILNLADMISEFEASGIPAILANATVDSPLKAWYLHYMGLAHFSMGREITGLEYFQTVLDEYPDAGLVSETSGYAAAFATASLTSSYDPVEGVAAYQGFIDRFPNSPYVARALLEMGEIYNRLGDPEGALAIYQVIVSNYPNFRAAGVAEGAIDYILRNEIGVQKVAGAPSAEDILAQACGPRALHHLLALNAIPSTVEELLVLAGTTEHGTSMYALAEAANAKGLELVGVKADSLGSVEAPFLAFVNDNHFVLVEEAGRDFAMVRDGDTEPRRYTPGEFSAIWKGQALVVRNSLEAVLAMGEKELLAARGGMGGDPDDEGGLPAGLPTWADPECVNNDCPPPPPPPGCDCGAAGAGNNSCPLHPSETGSSIGASFASSSLAGATDFSIHGSTQGVRTGIAALGVHGSLNTYQNSLRLNEVDFSFDTVAGLKVQFYRTYHNPFGKHRGYYKSSRTSGTVHANHNNIGNSWTHNYNMHIVPSGDNSVLVLYTDCGNGRHYTRIATDFFGAAFDVYHRQGEHKNPDGSWDTRTGTTYEQGITILRDQSTGTFLAWLPGGMTYNFTAKDTTYLMARLTSIVDVSGNTISLSYDSTTVGWGMLTKVEAPSSDGRYLKLEYDTNLRMTKASMMKTGSGTAIRYVEYGYDTGYLTKVTEDGQSAAINYRYITVDSTLNAVNMSKITDKSGRDYLFNFQYKTFSSGNKLATKITLDVPDGRTTVTENPYAGSATVTNYDGSTTLAKFKYVNGPYGYYLGEQHHYLDNSTTVAAYGYAYANNRDLTAITGPGGNTVATYAYNSQGDVTMVRLGTASTDPTWTWEYGANGYPSKTIAPSGQETLYYYDTLKRLTKAVAPEHSGTNGYIYAYNSTGLITRVTDPDSHNTDYQFNARGDLTKIIDPYSKETVFAYDDFGRQTTVTDANSKTTTYYYSGSACSSCGSSGTLTKVTDGLGKSTEYFYDNHNDMTKMKDAQGYDTLFYYDVMHRQTKVTTPEGRETITTYNKQGQVTAVQDPDNKTTNYYYDFRGNLTQTTDPVGSTYYYYGSAGNQTKVKDGLNHEWTYAFDAYRRMTSTTDPSSKLTLYFYDKAGRVTKTGAGSGGTTLPTEYFYHPTKGYLTKVTYDGNSAHAANYTYNSAGELTKITDWLDGTNGIRYAYDNVGRLTSITDYDNTSLTYAYDSVGNVTSMTDYHGNATTYAYDARNMMTTLTAPGSKVWTFVYTDRGALNSYAHANGMVTGYEYDDDGALSKIFHLDGYPTPGNTVESYLYALSASGNITKTTHLDGSYWDYLYDGRNRLTSAVRKNSGATIAAAYTYTYDAGDNMITKVEPWADDFGDGAATDEWLASEGTWSVVSGAAQNTSSASVYPGLQLAVADDDQELRYTYSIDSVSSGTPWVEARLRWETSTGKFVSVDFYSNRAEIWKYDGSTWTMLAQDNGVASATGTKYNVRVELNGANMKVWRATAGGLEAQVFSIATAPTYNGDRLRLIVNQNMVASLDNVMLLADDRSSTTSFTTATNNELSTMADYNGSNTFSYDAWGRMTSKTRTGVSATYDYGYGMKQTKVTSTYPDEGTVTYQYGGDGKRRSRAVSGGDFTWWNYDSDGGWINSESQGAGLGNGAQTAVFIGHLGVFRGPSVGSLDCEFYVADVGGSIKSTYDDAKSVLSRSDYTPHTVPFFREGMPPAYGAFGSVFDPLVGSKAFAHFRFANGPSLSFSQGGRKPHVAVGSTNYRDVGSAIGLMGSGGPKESKPEKPGYCGSGIFERVPESYRGVDFGHCCKDHDGCYGCEGKKNGTKQEQCDNEFQDCLIDACGLDVECQMAADGYYNAVHAVGRHYFKAARKKDCDCDPSTKF